MKHPDLLDAAHIIQDRLTEGIADVSNGLSLCKLHHAAYDRLLVGISPDYAVHINADLLQEVNGPMLRYGLQEMHGHALDVPASPRDRPDRDRLAIMFDRFLAG